MPYKGGRNWRRRPPRRRLVHLSPGTRRQRCHCREPVPAALRQLGARRHAHTHDDQVGRQHRPVGEAHVLYPFSAAERADAHPEVQVDPVVGVEVAVDGAHLGPERSFERYRAELDKGHGGPELAGRGGHLGADPPGPDDHDPARSRHVPAQLVGIGDAAQVAHPGEVGAGHGDAARHSAGRQQQAVVGDGLARSQGDPGRLGVEGGDRRRRAQLDVVGGVVVVPMDGGDVEAGFAPQVGLRQWRALVRTGRLLAEQDHPAVEAFGAQRLRRFRPGQARSHDHERRACRHGVSPFFAVLGRSSGRHLESRWHEPCSALGPVGRFGGVAVRRAPFPSKAHPS